MSLRLKLLAGASGCAFCVCVNDSTSVADNGTITVANFQRVAHQLELAPKRGELGAKATDAAGRARLLRLPRKRGYRQRGARVQHLPRQHSQQ